jgi:hypothetical protein
MKGISGMKNMKTVLLLLLFFALIASLAAQSKEYEGPTDAAGDMSAVREGVMNGNRVVTQFQNTAELAMHPATPNYSSWWPRGEGGQCMSHGHVVIMTTRVYLHRESKEPVDDPALITSLGGAGMLDTLFYCQTHHRIGMDQNRAGTIRWGFYPVFGYFNPATDYPAMSDKKNSWPVDGWPSSGFDTKWPGEWNGRFGRGIKYADLEAYIVANDAQDLEYLQEDFPNKYYPRGTKKIGEINPDVSIQKGSPWGGLGLRNEARFYQWNNLEARDCIFMEFTIANISNFDYPEMAFGFWVDNGIGDNEEGADEVGFYDLLLDLAYSWDLNWRGQGGIVPGIMGFAFLESPGKGYDGLDNDDDGLLDEKRDNTPTAIIGPTDGIYDLDKFLAFYYKELEDLKDHWDADEDQDWDDGEDVDGDGNYHGPDDYPGDDVGLDGVGPGEINYTDADEGECDHRPSFREGVGCEPDFNYTDITESDMLGLTSFRYFNHPPTPYEQALLFFNDDRGQYEMIASDSLTREAYRQPADLIELFGSFPFILPRGRTERISMSELHSYENSAGFNQDPPSAPVMFQLKQIVQIIYERDYRFAQAPFRPTLKATPGDGYVILTWDNRADKLTREPFLNNKNDFEGYKIFRATDKDFRDAEKISDGFGNTIFKKPLFQCDIINGKTGFATYGSYNGQATYLGDDTGITHYYRDIDVQNGRSYYYAISAYDYGIPPEELAGIAGDKLGDQGIAPAENNTNITYDESETITFMPLNCAVVVAGSRAAGVTVENENIEVSFNSEKAAGSGDLTVEVGESSMLKTGTDYYATFKILELTDYKFYDMAYEYVCNGIQVYRRDGSDGDALVYEDIASKIDEEDDDDDLVPTKFNSMLVQNSEADPPYWHLPSDYPGESDIFDGIQFRVRSTLVTMLDEFNSGWLNNKNYPINMRYSEDLGGYPFDYKIIFTEEAELNSKIDALSTVRDSQGDRVTTDVLLKIPTNFYVELPGIEDPDEPGSTLRMELLIHDLNASGAFEPLEDRVLVGAPNTLTWRWNQTVFDFDFVGFDQYPETGDTYLVSVQRPFFKTDTVSFTVNAKEIRSQAEVKTSMKDIKVVPNPYIATNMMEPSLANKDRNQQRRLMFTHLPEKCSIKIFTVSGVLVRELRAPEESLVSYGGIGVTSDGILHWNLLSKEGLEIAAGLYFFYVEDLGSGETHTGKFAVVK